LRIDTFDKRGPLDELSLRWKGGVVGVCGSSVLGLPAFKELAVVVVFKTGDRGVPSSLSGVLDSTFVSPTTIFFATVIFYFTFLNFIFMYYLVRKIF
jgi:hypothetical protein